MVRKCKVCKGIMINATSDTCRTCKIEAGIDPDASKPKSKYVFNWDEYDMLLKSKVAQGKTYEQAKRELSFENNVSNKKVEEQSILNEKLQRKEQDELQDKRNKFKEEFKKLLRGEY